MTISGWLQIALYCVLLVLLTKPFAFNYPQFRGCSAGLESLPCTGNDSDTPLSVIRGPPFDGERGPNGRWDGHMVRWRSRWL